MVGFNDDGLPVDKNTAVHEHWTCEVPAHAVFDTTTTKTNSNDSQPNRLDTKSSIPKLNTHTDTQTIIPTLLSRSKGICQTSTTAST